MENLEGIKIVLSKEKSEEFFFTALCNGLGYFESYGVELVYSQADYDSAKKKLTMPCYEDILMQILRSGGVLKFEDVEGDGDGDNTKHITISDIHERVCLTPLTHLVDIIEGNDDAITADVIIQSVLFEGEIVFG